MKNTNKLFVTIFVAMLAVCGLHAQGQYESGMKKAFELWGEGKNTEAVAMFERIGQAEKDKWQPMYYACTVLITSSFEAKEMETKMAMLEKAKTHVAAAHERSPDNSEIYTMEGLLYTGYVAMDPPTYAMQFTQKINELHDKAIELNPNNPRALSNKIEYEMGAARFFGQDLKPFCKRLEAVLVKFDEQDLSEPFAPDYGKERVEETIANCGL